jgi:lipid-binding SYLF domain-containing protein
VLESAEGTSSATARRTEPARRVRLDSSNSGSPAPPRECYLSASLAEVKMGRRLACVVALASTVAGTAAWADSYTDTIDLFKHAGASSAFFGNCYGYAVFPTIGKGGLGIGGAHGSGHVYEQGKHVGRASMTELSVGFQLGGEAFSEIIFFQNRQAFDKFTSGGFKFDAGVGAVVITAGASADAGTGGANAGASGTKKHATTAGSYHKGMAVFTIVKGGAMYEMSVAGQKFSYKPGTAE